MNIDDLKPKETNEVRGDHWSITLPRTRIHTLEELLEYCKVDTAIWEVERFTCNKWEVAAKLGADKDDKRVEVTPLFQVRAVLKKRVAVVDARKEIDNLKLLFKSPTPKPIIRKSTKGGHLLELNIPDAHFGKLAWPDETDGPAYDTKIADATFREAVEALLARTSHFQFDEVLIVLGNDLLNSDDVEGRTTKGTHVSTDTRYQKTFSVVRTTAIWTIERCREIAPLVTVVMIPGNHDNLSVWHLGDSLECWFHKYKDVKIDNTPRSRKYYEFGQVMLMLTHGDKGKKKEYPLLMATEKPEMFGRTKFREIHCGHTHEEKTTEQHGIRVRVLSALCPPDDWHFENGLVGNARAAEAFAWHKDEGLVGTAIYTKTP